MGSYIQKNISFFDEPGEGADVGGLPGASILNEGWDCKIPEVNDDVDPIIDGVCDDFPAGYFEVDWSLPSRVFKVTGNRGTFGRGEEKSQQDKKINKKHYSESWIISN